MMADLKMKSRPVGKTERRDLQQQRCHRKATVMATTTPGASAAQAPASNKPPRQLPPQPIDPALRKRHLIRLISLAARTSRREIDAMVAELRAIADPLGEETRPVCMVCGTPFEGRSFSRFCSGRCRIRNWRAQQ
jgi:hypothetical protein